MTEASPEKELAYLLEERDVEDFIEKWCRDDILFHKAINETIVQKRLTLSNLMNSSRINRNYGYNIVNGRRHNPSRDKVIALCIAAKLSLDEAQEMLAIAKVGCLFFKRERDVRIAAAINNKLGDVLKVNIILEANKLEPLDV